MALKMNDAPYQRSPRTTFKIMMELSAALLIVWLAAVIYNFTLGATFGIRAILLMVVALVTTAAIDAIVALIKHKKGAKILDEVINSVVKSYSYVTAIIFTLCCPVYVSYYVIIIGCLASTGIKHCFGGFGRNIFNPAIIGRIFTGVAFTKAFLIPAEYADVMSGSTVTTQYSGLGLKWLSNVLPEGFNMGNLLIGNYVGAMGETFTLLILVLGVILAFRNVINWRSSAFYLGTVAITALFIGFFIPGLNPFTYMMYHLCLGGLMFGAIFMITDPVTSPTSPFGKALIGVIAGFLTVIIRLDGNNPEGVMYSIAIINILAPMIDRLVVGRTTDGHGKKWGTIAGLLVASMAINTALSVGAYNKANSGNTSSSTSSSVVSSSTSSVEVLTEEEILFGVKGATYTEVTLGQLPAETHISKVYLVNVKGTDTAISYLLTATFPVDTHGYQGDEFTTTVGVTIDLNTENVIHVAAKDNLAGTAKTYSEKAIAAVTSYIEGKTASEIALINADTEFDITAGSTSTGAIYSSNGVLKLVIESCAQYLVDRTAVVYGFAADYEEFVPTNLDTNSNIKKALVGKVEGVAKAVAYEISGTFAVDTHGYQGDTLSISAIVVIDIDNDSIFTFKVLNSSAGTAATYNDKAVNAINTYLENKLVSDLATVNADTEFDVAAGSTSTGAIYSTNALLEIVVDACSQYVNNDKAVLIGGAA